jgi:hypothetical protein
LAWSDQRQDSITYRYITLLPSKLFCLALLSSAHVILWLLCSVQGEKGFPGYPGKQGRPGDLGEKGDDGEKGDNGLKGMKGDMGHPGTTEHALH